MPKLFTLDKSGGSPTYLPKKSLEKFDSFIWTERYQDPGDFKVTIYDDISAVNILPLESLVSHTDTFVVMMVENIEVIREKTGRLKVEISGRSAETFLECRATAGCDQALYDGSGDAIVETLTDTPENAIIYLIRSKTGVTATPSQVQIPNTTSHVNVRVPDSSFTHVFERGSIYERVSDLMKISDCGLRLIRPNGALTSLDFQVHDGLDQTGTVIFKATSGDLDEAHYFWSVQDWRQYVTISSHDASRSYKHRDLTAAGTTLSGFDRRVMYVEADDLEGPFSSPTLTDAVATRAQTELDAHQKVGLLQAKVSPKAKPKFKINYDVGDLVKVFGEFSDSQVMRVTEHILTVDKTGSNGYPSLRAI